MEGPDAEYVPLLVKLESRRAESRLDDETAAGLVSYALTGSSDYWAERALDWVEANEVPAEVVADALRACIDTDPGSKRWPQSLRHRALRQWKTTSRHQQPGRP